MGMSSQVPPAPLPWTHKDGEPHLMRVPVWADLEPPKPLPWIYRDPQRWLLPSLILVAIAIAGALSL